MKINNVEKFRNEFYEAIKDGAPWDWNIETPSAIWKGTFEDYKETMAKYPQGKHEDGKYIVTSLPHPMHITDKSTGKEVLLTIDEDGVNFYKNDEDRFEYCEFIASDWHKNRLCFATHLMRTILERLN